MHAYNGKFSFTHYENSISDYFLTKKRKAKVEKSDFALLMEGANWLFDEDIINKYVYADFIKQIYQMFDVEDETEDLNETDRIILSNPYYYSKGTYLSVFKISLKNATNLPKEFVNNLIIENGHILLSPLTTENITNDLILLGKFSQDKVRTLNRHHLAEKTMIPSNSDIEKFIAVYPIDTRSNTLKISIPGSSSKLIWKFETHSDNFQKSYKFYELNINAQALGKSKSSIILFSLDENNAQSAFIEGSKIYIREDHLNTQFTIQYLMLNDEQLAYGGGRIVGSSLLDFSKNKRQSFTIQGAPFSIDQNNGK